MAVDLVTLVDLEDQDSVVVTAVAMEEVMEEAMEEVTAVATDNNMDMGIIITGTDMVVVMGKLRLLFLKKFN